MKIAVFGLGYVGSVVSACLAQDGHDVTGIDVDVDKVNSINNSKSPIVEPQLQEAIAKAVGTGRLRARTSLEKIGDCSFVSVGTPGNENGSFCVSRNNRHVAGEGRAFPCHQHSQHRPTGHSRRKNHSIAGG
jgi:UDP-glucose 6-dehydrogenase